MKIKHNKKRNTAFIYEAVVNEATVAMLKEEHKTCDKAIAIIKKHFHQGSILKKDLDCYTSLMETHSVSPEVSKRLLYETINQRTMIGSSELFTKQTELIKDINKELGPHVFDNFVPNYRSLATISQLFARKASPRTQIMLENELLRQMQNTEAPIPSSAEVDNLVYNKFVEKFNTKYKDDLLEEQKELLSYYISSFSDNAVELKIFLNEEIARLKKNLCNAKTEKEVATDSEMIEKTNQIIEKLDSYASSHIDDNLLLTILKTQKLVKEIYTNGDID